MNRFKENQQACRLGQIHQEINMQGRTRFDIKQSTPGTGHRVLIDYPGPLHFFDYLESFFHLERFQSRGVYSTQQLKPRKILLDAKANWMKPNPHRGSDFDDFLKSEGIYEEVMASPKAKKAIKVLGDSIQAREREAFAAGWNAFIARHPSFLISHAQPNLSALSIPPFCSAPVSPSQPR